MSTVLAVATGTGNSLFAADGIGHDYLFFAEDLLSGKSAFPDDMDRLGIIFPVYCGGIPSAIQHLVSDVLAERDNSALGYIFAVATNGGLPMNALSDLDRELQDHGLAMSYGAAVRMPDAYLPLKKKAVTEKETETIVGKTLEKIRKAIEDTENETIKLPKKIPGWRIMRRLGSTLKPRANEKLKVSARCTGCGICASICPNGNIWIENGKANMDNRCITCFACYHRCPENAIEYPGATGQYKGLVDTKELKRK